MAKAAQGEIAVIIAAMNAEATIGRAVASALAEPEVAEVVVVDDASRDATAAAARAADDGTGRLRILRKDFNGGPAASRNLAIRVSTAPLIALLDSDDYLVKGRMARLLAMGGDDWDLLADDILIIPEALAAVSPEPPEAGSADAIVFDLETFVLGNITSRTGHRAELGFLKPLIRRSFLDRHGIAYSDAMRLGEDFALYVTALAHGARFKVTPAAGYVAIERGASLSSRHTTLDLRRISDFDRQCLADPSLALTPGERRALTRHLEANDRKIALGSVLDSKRQAGWKAASRELLRWPRAIPYVARTFVADKTRHFVSRNEAEQQPQRIRLLMGREPGRGWRIGPRSPGLADGRLARHAIDAGSRS